jgi:DNA-directed RNA polymerase specialized sigma24 family protein
VGSQELFERYLAATIPSEDSESSLEALLTGCAPPILNRVVRSRLGSLYTPADTADLSSEAMLELLSRLRSLRETSGTAANLPFDALAAGVAANTVHRFFARRFPERNRLRKRLRYVIETGARFSLWLGANGTAICGLARTSLFRKGPSRTGEEPLADAADIQRCLDRLRQHPLPADPLEPLVLDILRTLGRPIDLSRLTGLVAEITGSREPSWVTPSPGCDEEIPGLPPDPAPSVAIRMQLRERVERLWAEVLLLSVRHRNALLLSARATSGAAVWLVVDLGVASFREVAGALETTPQDLAELWNRLPLEDLEIAARLGLDRQQVINLRSTARERLVRRENPVAKRGSGPISEGNRR